MKQRENIAADIPLSLADADEALTLYGRWAADRDSRRRCGSAEGMYRAEGWHAVEDRRAPKGIGLTLVDALVCQRALARVPDHERTVLSILYVPRRLPAAAQLRMLRIPPRLAQERHLAGLRMFDNLRRVLTGRGKCGDKLAPT